jgi:rhodanese-related sulfurtransferase
MGLKQTNALHVRECAYAGEISSPEVWEYLKRDAHSALIDVRTPPEWAFSGEPDLSAIGKEVIKISWKIFPSYAVNANFVASLQEAGVKPYAPLFFLCRTGGRSLDAACAATENAFSHCYNVTDGFEGPLNEKRQRGTLAGWPAMDTIITKYNRLCVYKLKRKREIHGYCGCTGKYSPCRKRRIVCGTLGACAVAS